MSICLVQKLQSGLQHWQDIASRPVINWIAEGVRFPFTKGRFPEKFRLDNKTQSKTDAQFISQEIEKLLNSDLIEKTFVQPHCVSPIHCIPKKSGSFRLITDLRRVNNCCSPPKFAQEGITEVLELIQPNDHLVTLDIKNGFFTSLFTIISESSWGFNGRNSFTSGNAYLLAGMAVHISSIRQCGQLWNTCAKKACVLLHLLMIFC